MCIVDMRKCHPPGGKGGGDYIEQHTDPINMVRWRREGLIGVPEKRCRVGQIAAIFFFRSVRIRVLISSKNDLLISRYLPPPFF